MNGILLGRGGMVGSVHGSMIGEVDSEICSMFDFFSAGIGYGNDAGNILRSTQAVFLKYMHKSIMVI